MGEGFPILRGTRKFSGSRAGKGQGEPVWPPISNPVPFQTRARAKAGREGTPGTRGISASGGLGEEIGAAPKTNIFFNPQGPIFPKAPRRAGKPWGFRPPAVVFQKRRGTVGGAQHSGGAPRGAPSLLPPGCLPKRFRGADTTHPWGSRRNPTGLGVKQGAQGEKSPVFPLNPHQRRFWRTLGGAKIAKAPQGGGAFYTRGREGVWKGRAKGDPPSDNLLKKGRQKEGPLF